MNATKRAMKALAEIGLTQHRVETLAAFCHPDRHPSNPKRAGAAYEYLCDLLDLIERGTAPTKRPPKKLQPHLHAPRRKRAPAAASGPATPEPNDRLDDIFPNLLAAG